MAAATTTTRTVFHPELLDAFPEFLNRKAILIILQYAEQVLLNQHIDDKDGLISNCISFKVSITPSNLISKTMSLVSTFYIKKMTCNFEELDEDKQKQCVFDLANEIYEQFTYYKDTFTKVSVDYPQEYSDIDEQIRMKYRGFLGS